MDNHPVFHNFFTITPSKRSWHIPFLAGFAIGIPLLVGYFLGNIKPALTASLAGLTILYIPNNKNIIETMGEIFVLSFGMIFSYIMGIALSFNDWFGSIGFGIFSIVAYYTAKYHNLRPPGSFFYIMIASMAISLPHPIEKITQQIGIFALGTFNVCVLVFLYTFLIRPRNISKNIKISTKINHYTNFKEALIVGIFMTLSIALGKIFGLEYPYWIPISCLAVLQGVSIEHIWQRGIHRILGTTIGLGIAWVIFTYITAPLGICFCIITLQIIVELLIVRHYGLAVIFITPMGILLAETGSPISLEPNHLLVVRLIEIFIGSLLGAIGGWFLYNEKVHKNTLKHIQHSKKILKRSKVKRENKS